MSDYAQYLLHGTTIVGWTYQAEEFHGPCLPPAFAGNSEDEVTKKIQETADELGITDKDDPLWLSSEHFPQPIFATDADCRYCDGCHAGLIEGQ